jgi:hypothetical protein
MDYKVNIKTLTLKLLTFKINSNDTILKIKDK